jgi:hypothetical protein
MNDLPDLLDVLSKREFLRLNNSDPTIPPRIPTDKLVDYGIDPDGNDIREVDVGRIIKPIVRVRRTPNEEGGPPDDDVALTEEFPDDEELDGILDEILGSPERSHPEDFPPMDPKLPDEIDAYAWYCPFHYYGADYGIYINKTGIHRVAIRLAQLLPPLGSISRMNKRILKYQLRQAAFIYFFIHEHYHHKVESFCTRLELVENQPRFIPSHGSVYDSTFLSDDNLEEALANGEIVRRLKKERTYKNIFGTIWRGYGFDLAEITVAYAKMRFSKAPGGYRRAVDFEGRYGGFNQKLFETTQFKHLSQLQASALNPLSDGSYWTWSRSMLSPLFDKNHVVYEVLDGSSVSSMPPSSKPLMQVSPRRAVGIASKWGLEKIKKGRTMGDHQWLKNKNGDTDHVDMGYHSMSRKDWQALLGLINKSWGTEFKPNVDGIRAYLLGPRKLGLVAT